MFADWNPVLLAPYAGEAWYKLCADGLAIRQVNLCGEVMDAIASHQYVDTLLGVDIRTADDDTLQRTVCGVLMDETIPFQTVGAIDEVKQ